MKQNINGERSTNYNKVRASLSRIKLEIKKDLYQFIHKFSTIQINEPQSVCFRSILKVQSISSFLNVPSTPNRSVAVFPLPGRRDSLTRLVRSSSRNQSRFSSSILIDFSCSSNRGPAFPPVSFGSMSIGMNFATVSKFVCV